MIKMEIIKINPHEKPYTSVNSEFIKTEIRSSNWNDRIRRDYIDSLLELEEYVLHGARGCANALYMGGLKDQYKREYDIIFKELRPEEYERLAKEEERRELERQEEDEKERKEFKDKEERQRREWLEAGGTE